MAPKESAADTRRYFLQTAFLQKAVEASKIKVSKKEAEKWAQKMMRAMDQQLANNGEDFKKYYEGTGTTEKELMDEFIKEAELIKKDIAISKGEEYIGTLIDASYNKFLIKSLFGDFVQYTQGKISKMPNN
ncbi:hypothetical protein [Dorea sp. 210702-DFI.3.125]|nr:hypothetical protein [Dorea sp. 210702-DFI.3.125]MCB6508741.1 hypothetical protein [Dorea sp. 210702-DFI.3.125]